ncbi:MAG: GNAT family N-acetyltransferase [Candidatus Promineifilaceae bacterium]
MSVTFKDDLAGVDWQAMKEILTRDEFDNGRTSDQLQRSFAHSYATCIAYDDERIIGTARALSDGVCNAYIVDVWTYSPYRRRGIARQMMEHLLATLQGQHVYLFTDDAIPFYRSLGFKERNTGLELVVGEWLVN